MRTTQQLFEANVERAIAESPNVDVEWPSASRVENLAADEIEFAHMERSDQSSSDRSDHFPSFPKEGEVMPPAALQSFQTPLAITHDLRSAKSSSAASECIEFSDNELKRMVRPSNFARRDSEISRAKSLNVWVCAFVDIQTFLGCVLICALYALLVCAFVGFQF